MGVRVVTPGEELNQPIRGSRMGFCFANATMTFGRMDWRSIRRCIGFSRV
jgi:hypothetical protein